MSLYKDIDILYNLLNMPIAMMAITKTEYLLRVFP